MLFLAFQVGDQGYALAADRIVEVLPLMDLQQVGGVSGECGGLLGYRGAFVPVIDLHQLQHGRPAQIRMGTRIVLLTLEHRGRPLLLGLIVEGATRTMRCEPAAFSPFAAGPRGLVQRLDTNRLLERVPSDLIGAGPMLADPTLADLTLAGNDETP